MKILYDHQTFQQQKFGGISRYFFELMNHFHSHNDSLNIRFDLTSYNVNNDYLNNAEFSEGKKSGLSLQNFLGGKPFPGRGKIYRFLCRNNFIENPDLISIDKILKKIGSTDFDIFHPTYFDDYFLTSIKKPFVITVYDMIHQLFPDYFNDDDIVLKRKKNLLDKASHIIAISENTKIDIINHYNINENKISVVHLATTMQETIAKPPQQKLPDKYLLFVGMRGYYKNFIFFLNAVAPLLRTEKELFLICAGSSNFTSKELNLINDLGLNSSVIHFKFESDSELKFLYENAELFIYPSLYEGFGIPLLEAFSANCPVVCSQTSSFKEVANDAAVFCNPLSATSISDAVSSILKSTSLKTELRIKGRERLTHFSWTKCANEHALLYNKILNGTV